MTTKIGVVDRILRVAIGLALIAAALGLSGPAYQSTWGWIALVPLAAAVLISWCPAYTVGIRTCKPAAGALTAATRAVRLTHTRHVTRRSVILGDAASVVIG